MRPDLVLLADIIEAARRIAGFLDGLSQEEFLTHPMPQSAVIREIEVMGEAASRISALFKADHDEIPWNRLVDLRNFYIHAYHRIDYKSVWRTATGLIPRVRTSSEVVFDLENP